MKTFVQAAEDRGMPVILDLHNFARYSFDGGKTYTLIGSRPTLLPNIWPMCGENWRRSSRIIIIFGDTIL